MYDIVVMFQHFNGEMNKMDVKFIKILPVKS
jgi:hypothetical protein